MCSIAIPTIPNKLATGNIKITTIKACINVELRTISGLPKAIKRFVKTILIMINNPFIVKIAKIIETDSNSIP